jgi:hypothetical protein
MKFSTVHSHQPSSVDFSAPGGALGNTTESTSKPISRGLAKAEQRLITRTLRGTASAVLGYDSRVATCENIQVPSRFVTKRTRAIIRNLQTGNVHYAGVNRCGDVWCCPVCTTQVNEGRRNEILKAVTQHIGEGKKLLLITFTHSHSKKDPLKEKMAAMSKALTTMKGHRKFREFKQAAGYLGQIKRLETTYGDNGWHPHTHELCFIDSELSQGEVNAIRKNLFDLWFQMCKKFGLGLPNFKHGVDVKYVDGTNFEPIAKYIAKMDSFTSVQSLTYELTYMHTKKSRNGGRTPFDILRDITLRWTLADAQLFREYAKAMKGRAQIFWSRGLKDHFSINDQSDDELINDPEESEQIRELTSEEWGAIVKLKKWGEVLNIADDNPEFLDTYISHLIDLVDEIKKDKNNLASRIRRYSIERMKEILGGPIAVW